MTAAHHRFVACGFPTEAWPLFLNYCLRNLFHPLRVIEGFERLKARRPEDLDKAIQELREAIEGL